MGQTINIATAADKVAREEEEAAVRGKAARVAQLQQKHRAYIWDHIYMSCSKD